MIYHNQVPSWAHKDSNGCYTWGYGIKGVVTNDHEKAVYLSKLGPNDLRGYYLCDIVETSSGIKYKVCDYIFDGVAHNCSDLYDYLITTAH